MSAEVAKNVYWPCLSPLPRWGNLNMAFTSKFIYIYIYSSIIVIVTYTYHEHA